MRTLIVPDIHERVDLLKEFIEPRIAIADRVVFLGDYFDKFGLSYWEEMLSWLLVRIEDPKFTFHLGNHDVHYLFTHQWFTCSGYERYKRGPIRNALLPHLSKFRVESIVGNYLCSHAGWAKGMLKWRSSAAIADAIEKAANGEFHPIWGAGIARGGNQPTGGPLWLDWKHEFDAPEGLNQIVGHTQDPDVRRIGDNWCLDTSLRHVAWHDDDKLTIERIRE